MRTANNTVLITGGTSGIGRSLAQRFLQEGNRVIVTGTNAPKANRLKLQFPDVTTELVDMRDRQGLDALVQRYPDVNILVNNAGVQYNYDFVDPSIKAGQIEEEFDINLIGLLYLTKRLLPQLLEQSESAIINVSSGLGLVPKQSAPIYCASKAALHSFTKSLRWQLESTSVRVLEVIPPMVDTPMTQGRGRGKISSEALVEEFWKGFRGGKVEMRIGKTKLLVILNRLAPTFADRIMRHGL